ncbi:MAG: translation elongation factor Ts [Exilispira sp.]|jgi:elongation factor Ts|nr:translation elongation factor Ts [Exilispira sp.]
MNINKDDIKKLREMTGAGIGDCRVALEEANGDFEKAIQVLKERGLAKAVKKADRAVSEGRVAIYQDKYSGILAKIECETDFVANSEDFRNFAKDIAKKLFEKKIKNVESIDSEIEQLRTSAVLKFNENIKISDIILIEGDDKTPVFPYVQMGKNAAIVQFELDKPMPESDELKDILFSIVVSVQFYKPEYYSMNDIPKEKLDEEIKIVEKQVLADPAFANKPQNVLQGIIQGKAKKSFTDKVFLECPYVRDESKKVGEILSNAEKKFNIKIKAKVFKFTNIGSN